MTLAPPGSTCTWPIVATAPGTASAASRTRKDLAGRRDERVFATDHRRRPRVARVALENGSPARIAHDPGHDPDRLAGTREHGPLLDVEASQKDARQRHATRDERSTSDASDLLTAKDDHRAGTRALDGLQSRNDAERAVEAAATRNAVQLLIRSRRRRG